MTKDMLFSPKQLAAIRTRGENLLVAAGAGSGKTTVLVQRILQYLRQGGNIERVLALTFTSAAAAEMREKLDRAISALAESEADNRHLREQLSLLPQAQISTIHSFCLDLIRRHYYRVGLDAGFRVADEAEIALLENEILLEILECAYAEPQSGVAELADAYGGNRDDSGLIEVMLSLHRFCRSRPRSLEWLKQACSVFEIEKLEQYPFAAAVRQRINTSLRRALQRLQKAAELAADLCKWRAVIDEDAAVIARAAAAADVAGQIDALREISFGRLVALKDADPVEKEQVKKERDAAKELVKTLQEKYAAQDSAGQLRDLRALYQPLQTLYRLVERFEKELMAAKRRRGWVDFADMEHLALSLLEEEEFSAELARGFDEILIDEYQDVNEVQEAILRLLSRGDNFFAVGDVKQSIYRFRLAEPRLFLDKYHNYGARQGGSRIDLNCNYRSTPAVIDAVNFLFRQLMRADTAEIEYDGAAELKSAGDSGGTTPVAPEFYLIDLGDRGEPSQDGEEPLTAMEAEARLIARRMRELHAEGYAYHDMAVLLRNFRGQEQVLAAELARANIPALSEGEQGFLATPEVSLILSALRVIDNPRQDIPLAAVLRSPLGGFSPEELVELRFQQRQEDLYAALIAMAAGESALAAKCGDFLSRLAQWRAVAGEGTVSQLLSRLYGENGYYQFVGALSGGALRQANLQLLLQEAYAYERGEYAGLFRFIRLLSCREERRLRSRAARPPGERQDAVRVMSIHKSKGLEFPVVFIAGLAGQFNFMDERRDIIWERDSGLGPLLAERDKGRKYPTLAHTAVADRLRELAIAEEMRIYYVALTRAKERLILSAAARNLSSRPAKWAEAGDGAQLDGAYVLAARTPLDWLAAALLRHHDAVAWRQRLAEAEQPRLLPADGAWRIAWLSERELRRPPAAAQSNAWTADAKAEVPPPIRRALTFRYPGLEHAAYPAKWTVTALTRLAAPDEPGELAPYAWEPEAATGADERAARGIAYHRLLEKLSFELLGAGDDLRGELRRLLDKGLLQPQQARLIDTDRVARFLESDLGRRLRAADQVERELEFTMLDQTDFGERIMVQGMLDAAFREEQGWVLLDYKTGGRGKSDDQLRELYGPQLKLYSQALRRLLGGPVAESWLVMLDLARFIALD
ncbi:MAG: helicase-exonuclease AddAB subunit AddA [Clostridia bacterium]|nr:helicase-exonuclease AddAB subunit AddA [Clostridia bacterium]